MTEHHLTESVVGLAGRLSHIPYGTDKVENCGWHSSRNFNRQAPVFRALGPYSTWIPAESDPGKDSLQPPGTTWTQIRRQKRWLLKNHPEASLGNLVLHEHLLENGPTLASQQDANRQSCFFSLGELTNISPWRATGAPLVVTVTGSARNILRLTKLDDELWSWSKDHPVAVRLAELCTEKPALWIEEDVGPIRRVKCLVDLKQYNPTRWLAVQRDSGTTICQPEYRPVSEDDNLERNSSRIAANPLFHLPRDQTGGAVHSDVSFNPGTRSKPPQIGIIDEQGFWSVWDVIHTRYKPTGVPTARLKVCGHLDRGVMEQLPYQDRSELRWHKLLWVGRSEDDLDILSSLDLDSDADETGSQVAFPPLHRSSLLLAYNSQRLRLFDLTTGLPLPDLEFIRQGRRDYVLDVHRSHDPQYFYVLTTAKLFVVRAYTKPGVEWDKPEKTWTILFSTPHFRSPFDRSLQLGITQGVKADQPTSLVFLYSSANSHVDLFSVELPSKNNDRIRCQPNIPGIGSLHDVVSGGVRTLCIYPTPIVIKTPGSHSGTVQDFSEKRIRLYQVFALKPDLSLVSALCASSSLPSVEISPPTKRFARRSRAERQWRRAMRHMASNFVVPDDATVIGESPSNVTSRFVQIFYERLNGVFARRSQAIASSEGVVLDNPFEAVDLYVRDVFENGLAPLHTLFELMPKFEEMQHASIDSVEWEAEIQNLNNRHPSLRRHALDILRPFLGLPLSASLQEAYLRLLEIVNSSLHSTLNDANVEQKQALSREIAYELYFSVYGIGHKGASGQPYQAVMESQTVPPDSQIELPSSPPLRASAASAPAWPRSGGFEAVENNDEDAAMVLLRAYTGTGKFLPRKQLELLDKWKLGADPSNYVFDLDRSGDAEEARQRKEKRLAREDRKRRRAETLLHLSQEPDLPATQPTPEIRLHHSQTKGFSSQRQLLHSDPLQTMSQPATGIFGRRPTKKAKKRKGGF
ncbi:hypothetical protein GGS20DRAFT_534577 [Poronia punctata]|nr:hypothetical protein GGS20DRAFT_534577 [Poronia punctata]